MITSLIIIAVCYWEAQSAAKPNKNIILGVMIPPLELSNMEVTKITNDNFEEEVLKSTVPVILDFWADWCGPCKMQSPIIEEAAEAMGDRVKFGKVNVDEEAALALKYQIMSIPTLVVMKDGIFKGKAIGLQNMEAINQLVADAIKE